MREMWFDCAHQSGDEGDEGDKTFFAFHFLPSTQHSQLSTLNSALSTQHSQLSTLNSALSTPKRLI
ncbi:hypothetical protein NOS3756_36170 [Nostoc sp. NIES-3756]|nr:hypothetical protein NOS3756_36170 [Nostoc sp. NIES-3756]